MKPLPIGSRRKDKYGYMWIKTLEGWRQEHRVVLEQKLGRPLLPWPYETGHHNNGARDDNRPGNLKVVSAAEHAKLHRMGYVHSAATRAKISAALKGRQISARTRAKIAAAIKGSKHTEETRAKMSLSHLKIAPTLRAARIAYWTPKRRKARSDAYRGRVLSDATRAKISARIREHWKTRR